MTRNCMAIDIDQEDEDEDDVGIAGKREKYISPEDSTLPPISHLLDIFLDVYLRSKRWRSTSRHGHYASLQCALGQSLLFWPIISLVVL